jgi:serine/threonine-protein kinase RsbW
MKFASLLIATRRPDDCSGPRAPARITDNMDQAGGHPMSHLTQPGASRLNVETVSVDPCIVVLVRGIGDEATLPTLANLTRRLAAAGQPRVVLDLRELVCAAPGCARAVSRLIGALRRASKEVWLVRCPEWLYRQLQADGLGTEVHQTGSVCAASEGLLGPAEYALHLSLRSLPQHLRRLRRVATIVGARVTVSSEELQQITTALGEAWTNAMTHGSPQGDRNLILVSFHLSPDAFIIDIIDEGPGFDPQTVPEPDPEQLAEHGYGLHIMRQMMDRVDCLRDARGAVVRLTKYCPAAPTAN